MTTKQTISPDKENARSQGVADVESGGHRRGLLQDTVIEEPVSTYALEPADLIPKTMAKWFWDTYDGLLRWAVMNLSVFFLGSVWGFGVYLALAPVLQAGPEAPLLVRFFLVALIVCVIAAPINAFALSWMMPLARGYTHYTEPDFRWPPRGLRHFRRYAALAAVQALANFFMLFNILFYATQQWEPAALHWMGLVLAGLFCWALLGVNAMLLYMAPMIADGRWTWREMLRRGLFIVFVHKWFTLAVLLMTGAIWALGLQLRLVGLAVFCHALTVTLINAAYQTVVDFHRAKEVLQSLKDKPEAQQPRTWQEKRALEEQGVLSLLGGKVQPTRYQRTLRDMIKPWD